AGGQVGGRGPEPADGADDLRCQHGLAQRWRHCHQRPLRADASSPLKKLAAWALYITVASNPVDERCRPGPCWPPESNIATTIRRASPSAVMTNTLTHRGTPAVQRIFVSGLASAGGGAFPRWCSTSFILIFSMTTTISTGRLAIFNTNCFFYKKG